MDSLTRKYVLIRDGRRCQNCGENGSDLHVHHIEPRAEAGEAADHPENLVALCGSCHGKLESHPESRQRSLLKKNGVGPKLVERERNFIDRLQTDEEVENVQALLQMHQNLYDQTSSALQNYGLLTEDDREFWHAEKGGDETAETRRQKRHAVRERIENIVEDLRILSDADERDLVDEFHGETDREAKLEQELKNLRSEIREDSDSA